jgi:hypothetical protein
LRLRRVIALVAHSQREFAEQVGCSASYVTEVLRGRSAMGWDLVKRINARYGFSLDWILSGEGSPWGMSTTTTTEGPVVQEAEVVMKPCCGECGSRASPGMAWCMSCGARLKWGDSAAEPGLSGPKSHSSEGSGGRA